MIKVKGGLVLTNGMETDSVLGKIVAISDNCFESLNIGDKCIIPKFVGNKIQYQNDEYLVVDIENILAVIEED